MEHGLDARHAEIFSNRSAVSRGQSRCANVRSAVRVERELHTSLLSRRGRPHEGRAAKQDAWRRMAKVCEPARAVRLHVGASRQEASVHGWRVRTVARME